MCEKLLLIRKGTGFWYFGISLHESFSWKHLAWIFSAKHAVFGHNMALCITDLLTFMTHWTVKQTHFGSIKAAPRQLGQSPRDHTASIR